MNMPVFQKNYGTKQLTLFSERVDELESASSINDTFKILSLRSSFLDFGLFTSIVKHYDLDKGEEVFRYSEHVDDYLKRHKVKEFMIINPALGKLAAHSEKLVFKFDISTTTHLGKVMNLKTAIAKILGLQSCALQLLDISEGCVVVTFLISALVLDAIFTSGNPFTDEQITEFQGLSVIMGKSQRAKIQFQ